MENLVMHCEQLGTYSVQWLNIFTNIIFFLFAFLFFHSVKNRSLLKKSDQAMILSLVLIGLGSFFWHAFPTIWSSYLDIVSIILFSIIILTLVVNKVVKNSLGKVFIITFILTTGVYLKQLPDLNNSLAYLFIILVMYIMSFMLPLINKSSARVFFRRAFFLFLFAFIAQKLDIVICDFMTVGSHFVWHILVAWMGYYLIKGIHILYE